MMSENKLDKQKGAVFEGNSQSLLLTRLDDNNYAAVSPQVIFH